MIPKLKGHFNRIRKIPFHIFNISIILFLCISWESCINLLHATYRDMVPGPSPYLRPCPMKKFTLLFIIPLLFTMTSCNHKIKYPVTKKVDTVDNYFGTKVADPYRWLENDTSTATAGWVKEQNQVTN